MAISHCGGGTSIVFQGFHSSHQHYFYLSKQQSEQEVRLCTLILMHIFNRTSGLEKKEGERRDGNEKGLAYV